MCEKQYVCEKQCHRMKNNHVVNEEGEQPEIEVELGRSTVPQRQ